MGYYVKIQESTFMIPVENLNDAYEKMCSLNHTVPNSQKRGGSWPDKNSAPEFGPHSSCWFSWLNWNYSEICKDAQEVLEHLGFETEYNENGDLLIVDYDQKTGQEDLFLNSISSLAKGYIIWKGEDDSVWGETYGNKNVIVKHQAAPDYSSLIAHS